MSNTILTPQNQFKEISLIDLRRIAGGGSKDKDKFPNASPPLPLVQFDGNQNFQFTAIPLSGHVNGNEEYGYVKAKLDVGNNFYISGAVTTNFHNVGSKEVYFGIHQTWK